ncbi:SDR family NAD(P)-dependent oxidoreductase [Photobacterium leiognathi]|uniref:SDR family NAD(P)-dependent oxidoreductase n=1 Tax=Photobacterium leiognathi TaxID=553611 RepID=UPI002734AAF6|nr:SDR family NAD(P)-dependent oxidoreductase [Photobacterium leiognathi]
MISVIITGCTSGIGLAFHDLVTYNSSPNFQYIFIGRELWRLNQQVEQTYYELDLSKSGHIDWTSVYGNKPPKKITFISNAGTIDPIGRITVDNTNILRKAVNVNLISPMEMISSLILWAENHSISIRVINISSGAANNPIAGWEVIACLKQE